MNDVTVSEIVRRYNLGKSLSAPSPVTGGLLHQMYRLRTTSGDFAVKRLNPTIMTYDNVRTNFANSERIARGFASAGLPVIAALLASSAEDSSVLQDIGTDSVLIFPWIDAIPTSSTQSAGPVRTSTMGSLLGRMHALRLEIPGLDPPIESNESDHSPTSEADEWQSLADEAERQQLLFAADVRAILPDIATWAAEAREARAALTASVNLRPPWVLSHGDLDQKNVLWTDERTPFLIDWESAGHVLPAIEVTGMALDWSGQVAADLDVSAFAAFLVGYRREHELTRHDVSHGLHTYCGNWSGWLKFSLQRACGTVTGDPAEQSLGARETVRTLALLRSAARNIPLLEIQFGNT